MFSFKTLAVSTGARACTKEVGLLKELVDDYFYMWRQPISYVSHRVTANTEHICDEC